MLLLLLLLPLGWAGLGGGKERRKVGECNGDT